MILRYWAIQTFYTINIWKARNAMKNDLAISTANNKTETLTYDMEKVLGYPKLPANIAYYNR